MRLLIALVLIFTAIGCATRSVRQDPTFKRVKADLMSRMVDPECSDAPTRPCGLISSDIIMEYGRIEKEMCKPGKQDECNEIWLKMADARYKQRYMYADFGQAINDCNATPVECNLGSPDAIANFEIKLLRLHNASILERIETLRTKLGAIAEAEEINRRRRLGAALQVMGGGMQKQKQEPYMIPTQKTTNCTSYMVGNQMQTNCTGN